MAENKTLEHLPEVRAAVTALSPEDRELLEAVQASPFKLTAPEQFKELRPTLIYFAIYAAQTYHNLMIWGGGIWHSTWICCCPRNF